MKNADLDKLAAHLPSDKTSLQLLAVSTIDQLHQAVVVGDESASKQAINTYNAIILKMNGGTYFGCAADKNSPANELETFCRAIAGDIPKWGQAGTYIHAFEDIRILVELSGMGRSGAVHISFHAIDLDTWFISETGYRSHFINFTYGKKLADAVTVILNEMASNQRTFIQGEYRDYLACNPFPDALVGLDIPARRLPATLPAGYVSVDAVLPSHKAFIARKWENEALKKIEKLGGSSR